MSLLFNTLSRFVIAFLPRSNCLTVKAAMILEPKKIKSVSVSIFPPSVCHEGEHICGVGEDSLESLGEQGDPTSLS